MQVSKEIQAWPRYFHGVWIPVFVLCFPLPRLNFVGPLIQVKNFCYKWKTKNMENEIKLLFTSVWVSACSETLMENATNKNKIRTFWG